jgi:LPXTG-motif cell wall-anchored protein
MKHKKNVLALLMMFVMAMSLMTVTAFAAGTGTITIENSTKDKTYNVYKVFDATYDPNDSTVAAYTIKTSDPWYKLVSTDTNTPFKLSTYTVDGSSDTYQVTLKDGKTNEDVLTWFNSLKTTALPTDPTATGTGTGKGGADALKISGLDNGYYYVTSTLGTVVTLTNVNNSAEIVDKNQSPNWDKGDGKGDNAGGKFVKKAAEADTAYDTANTAAIGDTLEYKILLNSAPNYTANGYIAEYQFVDTAGAAIKEDYHSMQVCVDGTEIKGGYIKGVESNVTGLTTTTWHAVNDTAHGTTYTSEPADCKWYIENSSTNDNQFVIHIKWADADGNPYYEKLSSSTIKITYKAVLAGNASVGEKTSNNENSVTAKWLTGNGGLESGRTKTTKTTTFGFSIEKKDGNNNSVLEGVQFKLKKEGGTAFIEFYKSKQTEGMYYVVNEAKEYCDDVDSKGTASDILTTNENGKFLIVGLDAGNYVLTETQPLDGYNSIADTKITLSVPESSSSSSSSSHTVNDGWFSVGGESSLLQTVLNYKGTALPETGSTGTRLFILFGTIAVLGAGIFLVANKRMRKENF